MFYVYFSLTLEILMFYLKIFKFLFVVVGKQLIRGLEYKILIFIVPNQYL